jgi:hypothetical protein
MDPPSPNRTLTQRKGVLAMLPLTIHRVFLALHRIDFRRRFDGLLAEARHLGADPYAGDCVLFVRRDFSQARMIVGDAIGLYLICRRYEGSRLKRFFEFATQPHVRTISKAELSMILEGAHYTVHTRASAWQDFEI